MGDSVLVLRLGQNHDPDVPQGLAGHLTNTQHYIIIFSNFSEISFEKSVLIKNGWPRSAGGWGEVNLARGAKYARTATGCN